MCNLGCKHWEVGSIVVGGLAIQKCKECGKEVKIPATINSVIAYMETKPEYRTRLEYINKFYSRVI